MKKQQQEDQEVEDSLERGRREKEEMEQKTVSETAN